MYAITDVVVCAHGKSLKMRYKFSIAIIVMNNDIWNIGNIHHVIDRGIIKNNQLLVNYYYYRPSLAHTQQLINIFFSQTQLINMNDV